MSHWPVFATKRCQPIFINKASKSAELTEFLRCAHRKASLEIIETGFKKCGISTAHNGTEDDVVWGAKGTPNNIVSAVARHLTGTTSLEVPTKMHLVT